MRTVRDARPSQALQRVIVVLFCLVGSGLAIASGLDRESADRASLSRYVPAVLGAESLRVRASMALDSGDYRTAGALAKSLVLAAPVEPESTAILGATRLAAGDGPQAQQAFLVAGRLGWRTPITQLYWMQEALAVNDYRVSALRLDALLRQQPDLVSSRDLMAPLEETPAGRAALAERLRADPPWLTPYTHDTWQLSPAVLDLRADVLDLLASEGRPLGCKGAGPLTTALVNSGQIPRASAMWHRHCSEGQGGLLADADFKRMQVHGADSPFDWAVISDSDVSLSLDTDSAVSGRQLILATSASFPRRILSQLVVLAPGRYGLSWQAHTDDGAPSERIVATAGCTPDSQDWLPSSWDPVRRRYSATFSVDQSCPSRWLVFAILPGRQSLTFGGLSLQRLP